MSILVIIGIFGQDSHPILEFPRLQSIKCNLVNCGDIKCNWLNCNLSARKKYHPFALQNVDVRSKSNYLRRWGQTGSKRRGIGLSDEIKRRLMAIVHNADVNSERVSNFQGSHNNWIYADPRSLFSFKFIKLPLHSLSLCADCL